MVGIELAPFQYKFFLLNDGQKYEAVLDSTRHAIPFLIWCFDVKCFESFIFGLILLPFKTARLPARTGLAANLCQLFHYFERSVLVIWTKFVQRHIKHRGDYLLFNFNEIIKLLEAKAFFIFILQNQPLSKNTSLKWIGRCWCQHLCQPLESPPLYQGEMNSSIWLLNKLMVQQLCKISFRVRDV